MNNDQDSNASTIALSKPPVNDQNDEESNYMVEINDSLFLQIGKQIKLLRKQDFRHSIHSWTLEAIREKMTLEIKSEAPKISKPKFLQLVISKRLRNYIEGRVLEIKKVRRSYSKKKWISDAIVEKLERDQCQNNPFIDDTYSPSQK